MKAQDIVILLKIIALEARGWTMLELSRSLYLSQSEVSKALERLAFSGLIDESKKLPAKNTLYDVIINSIKYLFPVKPNRILKGIATAHSAEPMSKKIVSDSKYVWPDVNGKIRGESIEPLYKNAPKAALEDKKLYEMLSIIDCLRVGKVREQKIAMVELKKRFNIV